MKKGRYAGESREVWGKIESIRGKVEGIQGKAEGIRGKVVSIGTTGVRGWIYLESGETPEIQVSVNGSKLSPVVPSVDRPELQRKIGTGRCCGFHVEFKGGELLRRQKTNELQIVELNSGYRFGHDAHFFCPLVRKRAGMLGDLFFAEYYRQNYGLESLSNAEARSHYLRTGIYIDYDPNPWFSSEFFRREFRYRLNNIDIPVLAYINFEHKLDVKASRHFDPAYYACNNPDLHPEYGLLKHYVQSGHAEGRIGADNSLPDLIVRETEELAGLEPRLGGYFSRDKEIIEYPILRPSTYVPRLLKRRFDNTIKVVICVPFLSCGGADLISTYVLKAYQQKYGAEHVLFLVTDRSENVMPQWIAKKTQVVYLDNEATFDDFNEKVKTLHSVIGLLAPEKIVNVNSLATWEMYRSFGRQLATVIDLYAYLFCFDYTKDNRKAGYIVDYVPKTVKYLKRVFCDNQKVIDDMQKLYGFSQTNHDVFRVVYVPVPDRLSRKSRKEVNPFRQKILWVSRLARQKRPELLLQIAEELPELSFVVYGPPGDSPVSTSIVDNKIENVEYRGVFNDISDVDLEEFSLFLNTSAWDGLPTILIQIMGAGLPIVTSNAGGIRELVNDDTGHLVSNDDEPTAYSRAILHSLINYSACLARADKGFALTRDRHSWEYFVSRLEQVGAFDELTQTRRRVVPMGDRREYGS